MRSIGYLSPKTLLSRLVGVERSQTILNSCRTHAPTLYSRNGFIFILLGTFVLLSVLYSSQSYRYAKPVVYSQEEIYEFFKPPITNKERVMFMETLELLIKVLDEAGIRYLMFGGTLIGSWRHHDMVPWDDDVDIIVNYTDRDAIAALKVDGYTIDKKLYYRYKFFNNKSEPIERQPQWRWPYIDICFFIDTGATIHELDPVCPPCERENTYEKSKIFPLRKRPFGNLMLNGPNEPMEMVRSASTECKTRTYDHKYEMFRKKAQVAIVPCKELYGRYPFVMRNNVPANSDTEELYVLKTVHLPKSDN